MVNNVANLGLQCKHYEYIAQFTILKVDLLMNTW